MLLLVVLGSGGVVVSTLVEAVAVVLVVMRFHDLGEPVGSESELLLSGQKVGCWNPFGGDTLAAGLVQLCMDIR